MEALNTSNFDLYMRKLMRYIAIAMSLFHIITAAMGALPTMQQRCVHLGLAVILVYMQSYFKQKNVAYKAICLIMIVLAAAASVYVFFTWERMTLMVVYPQTLDILLGLVMTIAVVDGTRRTTGLALPLVAIAFVLYAYFGNMLPEIIGNKGYSVTRIVSMLFMETEGIYSSILGISATYIFVFILFGSFLESSGAGKFFIDLAAGLVGKKRGGSAMVSTISSGLFGMVSGSAVANIMAVGPLTVPMMTESGYDKRFAGSILSVAGTGGQLMPPIMGAAAFIMAETLGVPYVTVVGAAAIPAVLYYLAIFFTIGMRSNRLNIKPMENVPDWKKVLKSDFYLAFPLILLIVLLAVVKWSPAKAGFWSIVGLVAVAQVKKSTRMSLKKILDTFEKGAYDALQVALICSLAGIMIAMLSLTGLGIRISSLLLMLSGGNMALLLIITMIAGLILGMGMTTSSVYIILSVLVAPALIQMDVPAIAAHMFTFYFGILSAITPPVAVASYAAASVVQDNPMKLGFSAWKVGIPGYIIPFIFLYNPEILGIGSIPSIILATVLVIFATMFMAMSIEGFYKSEINILGRILIFAGAILLIKPGLVSGAIGMILAGIIIVPQFIKARKEKKEQSTLSA